MSSINPGIVRRGVSIVKTNTLEAWEREVAIVLQCEQVILRWLTSCSCLERCAESVLILLLQPRPVLSWLMAMEDGHCTLHKKTTLGVFTHIHRH